MNQPAPAVPPALPSRRNPIVAFFVGLFREVLDGHNAHLADGVERALGRAPRDFQAYARAAATAGAWGRRERAGSISPPGSGL